MGVIAPLNEQLVAVDWQVNGRVDVATVTFGIRPVDPDTSANAGADVVHTALGTSGLQVAGNYSAQWTYLGVRTYKSVAGGSVPGVHAASVAGTGSQNPVPPNCAILVQKHTALGGRANRGRMYWPPIYWTEVNVGAGGVATGSDVTTLQSRFTTFLADLAADFCPMVLMHSDGSPSVEVEDLTVQGLLATQRGRLR